jgi:hypothetical protein
MRSQTLIVSIALTAAIFGQLAAPALAGTVTTNVEVDVNIAPSDAGKYELHIGRAIWLVPYEGAALYPTNSPATVEFWRVRDCHLLASFIARPYSLNEIWVDPDTGRVTVLHPEVQDIPSSVLTTETPRRCPIPDTSTMAGVPGSSADWTSLALGALMVGLAVLFFRRDWRQRGR